MTCYTVGGTKYEIMVVSVAVNIENPSVDRMRLENMEGQLYYGIKELKAELNWSTEVGIDIMTLQEFAGSYNNDDIDQSETFITYVRVTK